MISSKFKILVRRPRLLIDFLILSFTFLFRFFFFLHNFLFGHTFWGIWCLASYTNLPSATITPNECISPIATILFEAAYFVCFMQYCFNIMFQYICLLQMVCMAVSITPIQFSLRSSSSIFHLIHSQKMNRYINYKIWARTISTHIHENLP